MVVHRRTRRRALMGVVLAAALLLPAGGSEADCGIIRSLDGSCNNLLHPTWGKAGTPYLRLAAPRYADGIGAMSPGPDPRYLSNRIFNDSGQNLFSENNVSQMVWLWGQFLDHVFGLAAAGAESAPIRFDPNDPLEHFRNDAGVIPFTRVAIAPNTGTSRSNPRQQTNTVSSYIDGFNVYGGTQFRLEWLREGPVDGDLSDNGARLLTTPDGYLPRATYRGNPWAAPFMATGGRLAAHPEQAAVAGDVRANENAALTAMHTLFVREHNRIVSLLPASLPEEQKFQIARRVVGAEQQYITYTEFLPTIGVQLPPYQGYDPNVDATLSNEFATAGYRAHSMIHGDLGAEAPASRYGQAQLDAMQRMGIKVTPSAEDPSKLEITIPLNVAFFNPDVVELVGLGPILQGMTLEPQYKNDEQIDNTLRSVLFQVPGPGVPDPEACFDDPSTPGCFTAVLDLGAIDVQRGRDHGLPTYNQLRQALGLPPVTSFTQITGESTDSLGGLSIDDPAILDFVALFDRHGNPLPLGSQSGAVTGIRRTTLAARLKAIYGSVDDIDAFVGILSERHVPGTEFGETQLALWKKQFQALRDGDRFFYLNDPLLPVIRSAFGITYEHSLGDLIALNTDVPRAELPANVFLAPED